jgi:thiazole synthase
LAPAAEPFADGPLILGTRRFRSRLILGTGKYPDLETMRAAHEAAGVELVTVAVRRLDPSAPPGRRLLDFVDRSKVALLPNTAGCTTAEEAIRTAHLGREAGLSELVKLEVIGDERTLLPDPIETLKACRPLVRDGFTVLVYASDDPVLARRIADEGVAAVMPAGSPIGSGQGVLNPNNIRILLEGISLPVIVDAGVGTASDVASAMELGIAGVLLNSGVACAREPVRMARAMALACEAGRHAFLAGRIPRRLYASASSPAEGLVTAR